MVRRGATTTCPILSPSELNRCWNCSLPGYGAIVLGPCFGCYFHGFAAYYLGCSTPHPGLRATPLPVGEGLGVSVRV